MPSANLTETISIPVTLLMPLLAAFFGLVGVFVGAWLSARRERNQRRLSFIEKQIEFFYSPMIGLRCEIKAHSSLGSHIQNKAEEAWQEICEKARMANQLSSVSKEHRDDFLKIIDYDNQKLQEELLPAYRKMVDLFREKYWLAESDTRQYYEDLVEFVEIWNRWITKSLPREVLVRLNHSEKNLLDFFNHIEKKHDELRQRVKIGIA